MNIILRVVIIGSFVFVPTIAAADQSIYCNQHQMTIDVGMSMDQVISACGQPNARTTSNLQATEKVPVKQLIYNTINTGSLYPGLNSAFYDQWSLPSGNQGISLMIELINDKVSSVNINGSDTNAMTICGGTNIQVGDDISQVYAACGHPNIENSTYVNRALSSSSKPEVWIYQPDQFQPQMRLTFINGRLESIN